MNANYDFSEYLFPNKVNIEIRSKSLIVYTSILHFVKYILVNKKKKHVKIGWLDA